MVSWECPIKPREASGLDPEAVHDAHHSYMDSLPSVNLVHHGIRFQENLVGAITYRYPLISRKRVRYQTDGQLAPEPVTIDEDLPHELRPTARRILDEIDPSEIVTGREVRDGRRLEVGYPSSITTNSY